MPLSHGPIIKVLQTALHLQEQNINQISNSQQLAREGELWGVYLEDFWPNWPNCNGKKIWSDKIYFELHKLQTSNVS